MATPNKVFGKFLIVIFLTTLALTTVVADPPQGRGRGKERKAERFVRDRDFNDDCRGCWDERGRRRKLNKKEEKFINGHDARDGRWDGRGPKSRYRRLPPQRRYFR